LESGCEQFKRLFNGLGGSGICGNETLPPVQHKPGGFLDHFNALQYLHWILMLPTETF